MVTQPQISQSKLKRMSTPTTSMSSTPPYSPLSSVNPYYTRWSNTPMVGETEDEAAERVRVLQDAMKRSKEIDDSLQETKRLLERRKKAVKILLLGQSESGKSSVLKNFQLAFAPAHFESERLMWKLIIQLNLISNIRTIIETLKAEWESPIPTTPLDASPALRNFRRIRLGLSPLFVIEANVMRMLAPESREPSGDVCVRAGSGWKALIQAQRRNAQNVQQAMATNSRSNYNLGRRQSHSVLTGEFDPSAALSAQRDDIVWLWNDREVQSVLRRRGVRLEQSSGFFMNDGPRIVGSDYIPTDSDIIRARIRTVGVEEHHFVVERGPDTGSDVYITDVGGSRSQRASWVPFFDDVQAILFLAPLAFSQTLEEDPRVNRLEDSLTLWREICANRLLAGANLILFFNKKDVLASTLASGVQVRRYVPSYGDTPNDVPNVTKYFKEKFKSYHKRLSPVSRTFLCYETSAIDINSMSIILVAVKESILRQNLTNGDMI